MTDLSQYTFRPWRKAKGTRVRLSDAGWREPLKWNRKAMAELNEWAADPVDAFGSLLDSPVRPRVFCPSLADVCEIWDGPILDHLGQQLFINGGLGADGAIYSFGAGQPEDDWGCRELTMDDMRRALFRLIDATPNLDWPADLVRQMTEVQRA